MSLSGLARRWHFARHVPPGQLLERAGLMLRRNWKTLFPPLRPTPGIWSLSDVLPQPVLPLRQFDVSRAGSDWRFSFLGRTEAMTGGIAWRLPAFDPTSQLWRMNLHYMEWLEAVDAETGFAAMLDWIAANPPYRRESWQDSWNSYTLSLRIMCWLQFLARNGTDHPHAPTLAQSLGEQLSFLAKHLETDIGGNHLIKNIKALIWGAACLNGPETDDWLKLGRTLLAREIKRQILPDGMHYELSPSYHAQVFADLIECHHALLHSGMASSGLEDTLDRMALATALLAHPDGGPAQFNDAGLTMAYGPGECLSAWAGSAPGQGAFALPDAGYFGWHGAGFTLVADMGRIGPDSLPAHAHGDIGSFELSVSGRRIIVDQGVFEYVEGPKRAQSRASRTHNTMTLGGGDQADFFGAFRCGKRPGAVDAQFTPRADGFMLDGSFPARHDGSAWIARCFDLNGKRLTITDRVEGEFSGDATQTFLLHPDCMCTISGSVAEIVSCDAFVRIEANQPLHSETALWWPDMGVERPTQRLRLTLPPGCRESALDFWIGPMPDRDSA